MSNTRIALFCLLVFCGGLAIAQKSSRRDTTLAAASELYSWWDTDNKTWNFCLLPITDRQKEVSEVFDPTKTLRGPEQLQRKLATFPKGTEVVWFGGLTLSGRTVQGSERLQYPPEIVIREIRAYASKRGISVTGPD